MLFLESRIKIYKNVKGGKFSPSLPVFSLEILKISKTGYCDVYFDVINFWNVN